jgi:hypothetical protein
MDERLENKSMNELLVMLDRFYTMKEELESRIRIVENMIFMKAAIMRNNKNKR